MALVYVYEQDYQVIGWPDDGGGALLPFGWFDHDLANNAIKPLYYLEPGLFTDEDPPFFEVPPVEVDIFPGFFVDVDVIYPPSGVRALKQPVEMLRNEIRRVR